ncbi:7-cyano-7-deazaguanine synthase [Nisaea sediminum]|uniref:7-cyano-7-deazaguanine synthase n=1 Tax=Nisaea sediminum TaxID=2775867 RepID=UPI0018688E26|nr:7-cyano-7-deazaguanine synthase [Nisaea sediminum]
MPEPVRATVLLSGGVDSTACVHYLIQQGFNVDAIFVDYDQAARELESVSSKKISDYFNINYQKIKLSGLSSSGVGELVGRNALFIFLALFTTRAKSGLLGLGLHAGTSYFDCSPKFLESAGQFVAELTDGQVSLVAPFLNWGKGDVYEYFINAGLPLNITYSCEAGTTPPCGECLSCKDRKELRC